MSFNEVFRTDYSQLNPISNRTTLLSSHDGISENENYHGIIESEETALREHVEFIKTSILILNKISKDNYEIVKLTDNLGTKKDTKSTRKNLHDLIESNTQVIKTVNDSLKSHTKIAKKCGRKIEHQKVMKDLQNIAAEFQKVQITAREKMRQCIVVEKVQILEDENVIENANESSPLLDLKSLEELDNEILFNETIIEEREHEIIHISEGIQELNGIFMDLARIVGDQGGMIDNIEQNVENGLMNVQGANNELTKAQNHQKRSRKLLCYILLFFIMSLALVILLLVSLQ